MNLIIKPANLPQEVREAAQQAVNNSRKKGFESHFNLKYTTEKLSLVLDYVSAVEDVEVNVRSYSLTPKTITIVEPTGNETPVIVDVSMVIVEPTNEAPQNEDFSEKLTDPETFKGLVGEENKSTQTIVITDVVEPTTAAIDSELSNTGNAAAKEAEEAAKDEPQAEAPAPKPAPAKPKSTTKKK